MDGGAENETIVIPGQLQKFIYRVIKYAGMLFDAGFAGNTAGERFVANPENIRVYAVIVQRGGYFQQRRIRCSPPYGDCR